MLDVQQPRVPQRVVVERRQVDAVPDDQPERQHEARPGQRGEPAPPARRDGGAHGRRQAEHQQRRRPVGDHHVLQQVDHEQVVDRDRLERRVERDRDERDAEPEQRRPPARRPLDGPRQPDVAVDGRGGEHEEERLEAERRRGRRAHVKAGFRCRSRTYGRSSRATQIPSVSSCSVIITTPGQTLVGQRRDPVRADVARVRRARREEQRVDERLREREHPEREEDPLRPAQAPCRAGSTSWVHTSSPASTKLRCSRSCTVWCAAA